MDILISTKNKNKIIEFSRNLEPLGYSIKRLSDFNIDINIQENGNTFEDNAFIKATNLYNIVKMSIIADDSGLEVDYLNKRPGIYSARYGGNKITDRERCQLILDELKGVPRELRTARYICAICYIDNNENKYIIKESCEGYIGDKMIGKNGFGYDVIFMNDNLSFAQLDSQKKDELSHRGKAIRSLVRIIKTKGDKLC